jgi:glycosyltransferase involved in cell wall biosynthesis
MTEIKVSVIIPVYNTINYLMKCLDSVLNQSLKEIEAVVVIDASPDNSIDVVHDYQKKDSRIKIVNKVVNEGLAAARNSGVAVSSGDYIIHLDSDDFWIDDNMLRELYEIAVFEGCDILRFNGYKYEDDKLTSLIVDEVDLINGCFDTDKELWCYRSVFLFFFRREFIDNNDLSFVDGISLGEDGIFISLALGAAKNVSSISKCFYAYRVNYSSMMNKKWSIDTFMEEETSSQIIANNISKNEDALYKYLFCRINIYWLSKISVKAKRELSKCERMKLYALARDNFIKLDTELLSKSNLLHRRAKLLHGYFLSSDFKKVDKFIDDVNCLRLTSVFSLGFLLLCLSRTKWIFLRCFSYLNIFKKILNKLKGMFVRIFYTFMGKDKIFNNSESLDRYNFSLPKKNRVSGVSAMLRVKNEERRIQACIESIVDIFDEVVVLDNGSDDSTLEIVWSLMRLEKYAGKIKVFSYPHSVARCGPEHSSTLADSVHSLAYYYNWSLSKCNFSVACKWDADMLLSTSSESRARFKSFLLRFVNGKGWALGSFPIQTVYIDDENISYSAKGEINEEIRIFPNSSLVYFTKDALWEVITPEYRIPTISLPDVCVYEIKDVADNEFSHWSTTKYKGLRKVREHRNYMRVKNNLHIGYTSEFVPSGDL